MKKLMLTLLSAMVMVVLSIGTATAGGIDICQFLKYPDNLKVFGVEMSTLDTSQLKDLNKEDKGVHYYELICDHGLFHDQIAGEEKPQNPRIIWGFVKDKDGKLRAYMRSIQFEASEKGISTTVQKMFQNLGGKFRYNFQGNDESFSWDNGDLKTKLKFEAQTPNCTTVKINQYFEKLRSEGHK